MHTRYHTDELALARYSGLLYLIIIICGIGAELVLRGPLLDFGSAAGTAEAIRAGASAFAAAIGADLVMAIADAALAILLYVLFRPFAPGLALAAMIFRLIQSVLIAANLMNMQAAWLLISGAQDLSGLTGGANDALALAFLNMHAHGYDLGLMFFGINSLLTGLLIWRSGLFSRLIGAGIVVAGLVYLMGSTLRFFAPDLFVVFQPAYGLTILAEGAFCIALLAARGIRRQSLPA
jgi:hypothetical protein